MWKMVGDDKPPQEPDPAHAEPASAPGKFKKAIKFIAANGLSPELLFQKSRPPPAPRSVFFNEPLPEEWFDKKGRAMPTITYPTNQVITAKYTILNFVFKNLLEQFRRVANIFFLVLVILQFFPKFSTINPFVTMLPLLAVLVITGAKDGYEDVKRHQSDRSINRQKIRVMAAADWTNPNIMEPKERSLTAVWYEVKHKFLGGDKRQSKKLREQWKQREALGAPAEVVSNPRTSTADAPGGGPAPDAALPHGQADVYGDSEQPATPALGRSISGVSSSGRTIRRSSTIGAASINSAYETTPDGRVLKNGRELTGDELSKYQSRRAPRWRKESWEDLRVGDFVLLKSNEPIPADIVICSTSEEEDSCFIETKNLDGETNLKSRHAVPELATSIRSARDCSEATIRVDAEPQDTNMYRLNASVILADRVDQEGNPVRCPVTLNQILLRGCVLRNTKWVIGLVLMTGVDTKVIANSGNTPSKRSKVEIQMNPMVYINLFILAAMAIGCAIADSLIELHFFNLDAYWEYGANISTDNPRLNGLVTFGNALITFQNIVPISLYISIEVVRTIQAFFIYDDADIFYEKTSKRTTARSWNLSDDLGQIQYIFSDKTGTLTQNLMLFRECHIGGSTYRGDPAAAGSNSVDNSFGYEKGNAPASSHSSDENSSTAPSSGQKRVKPAPDSVPFKDAKLQQALRDPSSVHGKQLGQFWRCLALCHTAVTAEPEPGLIEYKAQSPDEQALVQAAAEVGFVFIGKDRSTLSLQVPHTSEVEKYELLSVLEFTSARKRMSVILRRHSDSRILVLSKGADSIIFERSASGQDELKAATDEALEEFANNGLRTLCLAGKELSEKEYNAWAFRYHDASVAIERREEKMEELASELERGFTLYGATAIEDKLQDGVPETIADLKRAGINVWVATGDKLETAIAIGYSTRLLSDDMNLIVIRGGEYGQPNSAYNQLSKAVERFFGGPEVLASMQHQPPGAENDLEGNRSRASLGGRPSFGGNRRSESRTSIGNASLVGEDNGQRSGGYALVIDGSALGHALSEDFSKDLLLNISTQCKAVICCRVSPLQKALIVKLIKDGLGVMTLAIGDGANDVSMIQAAHVGIGIAGEEGLQAVNSSDYAIAQFRFLKRLLLVHGHWSYYRNGLMISNFFYKNLVNIFYLFLFQIFCAWSSTYLLDYIYILLWNSIWTVLAVIGAGVFDRPISDRVLMAVPELYRRSREGKYFGLFPFGWCMIDGAWQATVMLIFVLYSYNMTTSSNRGYDIQLYEWSTVIAFVSVFVANLFVGINCHAWTWWIFGAVFLCPVIFNIFAPIYASLKPDTGYYSYGNNYYLYPSFPFWVSGIFCIVLSLLPRILTKYLREYVYPTDIDILRAVDKLDPNHDYVNDPRMPTLRNQAKYAHEEDGTAAGPLGTRSAPVPGSDAEEGLAARSNQNIETQPPAPSFAMHPLQPTASRASSRHFDMLTGEDRPSRGYTFSHEDLPATGRRSKGPSALSKRTSLLGGGGGTLKKLIPGSLKRKGTTTTTHTASSSGLQHQQQAQREDPITAATAAGTASALPVTDDTEEDEDEVEALTGRRRFSQRGPEEDVEEEGDDDEDEETVVRRIAREQGLV